MAAVPVPAPAVSATDRAGVEVRLDGVRHRYADAYAVDDVSLRIGAGELVALLGPSGCCNSTLLRVVLPLVTALTSIDPALRHASLALGAGRWRTFFQVTLPLSLPGLLVGCLLVFASSVSAFVTQTLVGGGQQMFMPFYMYQQAIQANNDPFAAAVAVILLGSVLAVVTAVSLLSMVVMERVAGISRHLR